MDIHTTQSDFSCALDKINCAAISLLRKEAFIERNAFASAPNSRSASFKNPRCRRSSQRKHVRRNSVPDSLNVCNDQQNGDIKTEGESFRRVRSFKMTKKGLINRGDSYSSKGSLSSTGSLKRRERIPSDNSETSVTTTCSGTSSQNTGYYRIVVFGRSGVGKQSLVNQLMTSDYVGGLGSLQDLSNNEKCVSVLLDGEESTLEFRDLLHEKESISQIPADAYVIVFSVDDKRSFCDARDTVTYLRNDLGSDRAIVLVANKIDLVRKRQVTAADAKTVAVAYNCKYIETSATLNHQVDELLVCVLRQIRLLLDPSICSSSLNKPIKNDKKHSGLRKSKGFLSRFFRKNATDSRSCDNLFEL